MMGSSEADTLKRIQLLSTGDTRLWRNNVGEYWTGETSVIQFNGAPLVTIRNARRVTVGIPGRGGSDLIGLHTLTIKPSHVGKTMAIFTAVEVKSATGKLTNAQSNFIALITSMGGLALCARSHGDVIQALSML